MYGVGLWIVVQSPLYQSSEKEFHFFGRARFILGFLSSILGSIDSEPG